MTITRDDLEKVCNYSENSKPSLPQGIIAYIDMVEDGPSDEYLRELKRKNRELAIDAVLDNKIEEFKNRESFLDPLDNEGYVVVDENFNRLKVKNPKYDALSFTAYSADDFTSLKKYANDITMMASISEYWCVQCSGTETNPGSRTDQQGVAPSHTAVANRR